MKILAIALFGLLLAPSAQATWHSTWVPTSTQWSGSCQAISTVSTPQVCGQTYRGVEKGTQDQECQWLPPKGKIECKRGQHRSVAVTRSCTVVAPSCPVTEVNGDHDGGGCKDPSAPMSFRYDAGTPGDGMVTLKWLKRATWDKADITVYSSDKTTVLSKVRVPDTGSYVLSGLANMSHWFKIRGVNSCDLGQWSSKIDPLP